MISKRIQVVTLVATTILIGGFDPALAQMYGQTEDLAANQPLIRSSFNTRYDQIRTQIRDAVTARKLNASEADSYNSRLSSLAAETDQDFYSGGGISNQELSSLMPRLQSFAQEISTVLASRTGSASSSGNYGDRGPGDRWGRGEHNWGNELIGPINQRISSLQTRFATALTSGTISSTEQSDIKTSLDQVVAMRDRATADGLRRREANDINEALDRISLKIDQAIASPDFNNGPITGSFDQRMDTLRDRINRASRRRLLSQSQRSSALNSVQWMETVSREMTASGDFGPEEQQLLCRSIDRVAQRINGWVAENRRTNPY